MENLNELELLLIAIKNKGQLHWDAIAELERRIKAEQEAKEEGDDS